jgi:two-component system LytT family response regulator
MITVIIIDDEPLARRALKEYLKPFTDIEIIAECNDGFEGLRAIQKHQPQLIFLDIQMPKINGFEMLELVENPIGVIFTTAFDEFALKAFEAGAVDYLLKPFSKERLEKALEKFRNANVMNENEKIKKTIEFASQENNESNRIVVKNGAEIKIIALTDIHYIEAYDDYVKIHTKGGMSLKKQTLQFYENSLNPSQFVRIHRSYLLNITEITKIELVEKDQHIAILKNNIKLPLSRSGYLKLKETLGV